MVPITTNYPTGLDTDGDLPAKSSGNVIPSADWNRITDAIQALQAKVGIDASAVAGSVDNLVKKPHLTTAKNVYCDPNGSDSYDGLSERFPKATIAAVMTLAGTQADVWFGPANHTSWVDTITKPMGVRMHGTGSTDSASGGTKFTATGFPDDGRPGLITATNATADDTLSVIERIRFIGSGTMTGGGNCLELRNAQNASVYRDIIIGGWNSGSGTYSYDSLSTTSVNYPGYIKLERVWVTGGVYCHKQESGTTGIIYEGCAGDHTAPTLASFYITAKNLGAAFAVSACTQSGSTVTMTATGITAAAGNHVMISGVTPTGYNGYYRVASAPDANTITYVADTTGLGAGSAFGTAQRKVTGNRGESLFINCKQEGTDNDVPFMLVESTQRVTLLSCAGNKSTGAGSAPLVQWNGPSTDESNVYLLEPPITSIGTTNKNRPNHLVAPRFGGDNVDFTIVAPSSGGGRGVVFNYLPRSNTAVMDVIQTPVSPVAPPSGTRRVFVDPASGELSVRTPSSTTVSLEASAGGGAPTTADYLVATTQAGLSAEIVVGATPGGELGGTWGTPTVDTTHAGSAHTDFIAKAFVDAKGDVLTASAADTPARLAVGTDFVDQLVPDATQSSGLAWSFVRHPLRPSGALYETYPRAGATITNLGAILNSQRLQMVGIALPAGITVTSITFDTGTTALGTGVHQLFGLYRASDRVLLRGSVDDTSTAWAANTVKTLALTSTFVTVYSGMYYLGLLIEATTVPTLGGTITGSTGANTVAPILAGISSTGVSALPDPAGALTAASNNPYAYVS